MFRGARRSCIFNSTIKHFEKTMSSLPDSRQGSNCFIKMKDIALCAFSVFFTQCSSFLEYQKSMMRRKNKNNAQSLFDIEHIASDNYIRKILDQMPPEKLEPIYDYCLEKIITSKCIDTYKFLSDQVLIAVDGVQYFSSKKISCDKCSKKEHRNGSTTYSHSMVSATIVKPKSSVVFPLFPEFIVNEDGQKKQDCERNAIKRWLKKHKAKYSKLNATLLGDDLYSCHPICAEVIESGFNFVFTCKEDSHKHLYESVDGLIKLDKISTKKIELKEKRKKMEYICKYVNQVPLRDSEDSLYVNWCGVEVLNDKGKVVYKSAFVTNHLITDANVMDIIIAGRTRWKTENEHNNTLKNHGYHLEHNFGHGNNYLSQVLSSLILLSFLLHNMLAMLDAHYKTIRKDLARYVFFNQFRTLLFYNYFRNWGAMMAYMLKGCELEIQDG